MCVRTTEYSIEPKINETFRFGPSIKWMGIFGVWKVNMNVDVKTIIVTQSVLLSVYRCSMPCDNLKNLLFFCFC